MRPVKYLKPQLSPEDLEMEQACHQIMSTQGGPRKSWRKIQEVFESFMKKSEPFSFDDMALLIPEVSSNHIRSCLSNDQKQAMRERRSCRTQIQAAFYEMQLDSDRISISEIGHRTGHSSATVEYHLTEEQKKWIVENRRW